MEVKGMRCVISTATDAMERAPTSLTLGRYSSTTSLVFISDLIPAAISMPVIGFVVAEVNAVLFSTAGKEIGAVAGALGFSEGCLPGVAKRGAKQGVTATTDVGSCDRGRALPSRTMPICFTTLTIR